MVDKCIKELIGMFTCAIIGFVLIVVGGVLWNWHHKIGYAILAFNGITTLIFALIFPLIMDTVEEEVKGNGKDKKQDLDLDWTVPNPTPDIRDRANYEPQPRTAEGE